MASKLFLLLGLSLAILLLISSDVITATGFTKASSTANGKIDGERGGHWGGHGHGGHGGGHGGGGCQYGYCHHHCCRYAGEAEAQVQQPHN